MTDIHTATGDAIYNILMKEIDADLVEPRLHDLQSLYPDETPTARTERMARYTESFKKYDKAFADLKHRISVIQHQEAKTARVEAEAKARAEDEQHEEELLTTIATL